MTNPSPIARLVMLCWTLLALITFTACTRRNQAHACASQMHAILYVAIHEWPEAHDGSLPTNFLSMSNELIMTQFLVCPADSKHHPATNWSAFTTENCTYEFVTPGLRKEDTNAVFIRCPIHHYRGYADGRLLDDSDQFVRKYP